MKSSAPLTSGQPVFPLLLAQVCLGEGSRLCKQVPSEGESFAVSSQMFVSEETGSLVLRLLYTPDVGQTWASPLESLPPFYPKLFGKLKS